MDNIQKTVFKVSDFLSWNRGRSLILSPAFQRRPVWPKGAKSFLIDTIVRGIPMPIIFLRQRTDPKTLEPQREVVDGQQRLRTVISFVEPNALSGFDATKDSFTVDAVHNDDIAGKPFKNLPPDVRQRILDYDFSVQVLPADTDDRQVLQIFGRMNSTGFKLNDQELRNAEFFGAFKEAMYQLAYEQLHRWRSWHVFSETDIARMLEVEETSDLTITMKSGLHGKSQAKLYDFYRQYDAKFSERGEVGRRFQAVMDEIDDKLGADMKELQFRRKPLFHTLFTYFYDEMFALGSSMRRSKAGAVSSAAVSGLRNASKRISSGDVPESLMEVLRGATNHAPARKIRLDYLREMASRGTRK